MWLALVKVITWRCLSAGLERYYQQERLTVMGTTSVVELVVRVMDAVNQGGGAGRVVVVVGLPCTSLES